MMDRVCGLLQMELVQSMYWLSVVAVVVVVGMSAVVAVVARSYLGRTFTLKIKGQFP
jgi:hypothetical protein